MDPRVPPGHEPGSFKGSAVPFRTHRLPIFWNREPRPAEPTACWNSATAYWAPSRPLSPRDINTFPQSLWYHPLRQGGICHSLDPSCQVTMGCSPGYRWWDSISEAASTLCPQKRHLAPCLLGALLDEPLDAAKLAKHRSFMTGRSKVLSLISHCKSSNKIFAASQG